MLFSSKLLNMKFHILYQIAMRKFNGNADQESNVHNLRTLKINNSLANKNSPDIEETCKVSEKKKKKSYVF